MWGQKSNIKLKFIEKEEIEEPKVEEKKKKTNNFSTSNKLMAKSMKCPMIYKEKFVDNPTDLYSKFLKTFDFQTRTVGENGSTLNRQTCVFGDDENRHHSKDLGK
jgi:hypothetical protein